MFDGIDHVTLFGRDVSAMVNLYQGHLGFTESQRTTVEPGSAYHELWRLPADALDVRTLRKSGSDGGELRLVGVPGLPVADAPRSMSTPGPFALDFYVRDLPALYEELLGAGHRFRSPPVAYPLFGTDFTVVEVLLEAPLGLAHAFVEYLPDRHRCSLATEPDARVSEVVAAITVTDDMDAGLVTLRDALGGHVYFDQVFSGDAVETLIDLPKGSAFRAVLLRGAERRNARAELMEVVPAAATDDAERALSMVLSTGIQELSRVLDNLPPETDIVGPLVPRDGPHAGRGVFTMWTRWGAVIELFEAIR